MLHKQEHCAWVPTFGQTTTGRFLTLEQQHTTLMMSIDSIRSIYFAQNLRQERKQLQKYCEWETAAKVNPKLIRTVSVQVIEQQMRSYDLLVHMDLITFVTDRGSNFVCALRQFKVLHCVAHRLNNVLKRAFYQQPKKKKREKVTPNKTISKVIIETETTPSKTMKRTTTTTSMQSSPEFILPSYLDVRDEHYDSDSTDTTSDDDDDHHQCIFIDYSTTTIENLPSSAKHVLQTIKDCKSLVTYVKKVSDLSSDHNRFLLSISHLRQVWTVSCKRIWKRWQTRHQLTTNHSLIHGNSSSHQLRFTNHPLSDGCLSATFWRVCTNLANRYGRCCLSERKNTESNESTCPLFIRWSSFSSHGNTSCPKCRKAIRPHCSQFFLAYPSWKKIWSIGRRERNLVRRFASHLHPSEEANDLDLIYMAFVTMLSMSKAFFCFLIVGLKFFSARALQLLSSMFQLDDMHVMGAFLHPNYKSLRSASQTQIDDCHQTCRRLIATTREAVEKFQTSRRMNHNRKNSDYSWNR